MPNFLLIDTSGPLAAVAVGRGSEILARIYHHDSKSQAAELNILIEKVLVQSDLTLSDIHTICVCAGPGSYTGLRVGLGVAKGIAFALSKSIMLFDKLFLIAISFKLNCVQKAVLLKARQGEFFYALFDENNQVLSQPKHILETDLEQQSFQTTKDTVWLSDQENLPLSQNSDSIPLDFKINLDNWLLAANQRYQQKDFNELAYCEPFYLKSAFMTQAKNKLKL